jgi:hypothetical protein
MSVTKIAISGPPTQLLHSAFCLLTFAFGEVQEFRSCRRQSPACISCFFAVWIFTGCTTLITTFNRSSKTVEDGFNRIRAGMTNQETDEESTYYGAFFIWPLSSNSFQADMGETPVLRALRPEGPRELSPGFSP